MIEGALEPDFSQVSLIIPPLLSLHPLPPPELCDGNNKQHSPSIYGGKLHLPDWSQNQEIA
jgi:hypothetical protein